MLYNKHRKEAILIQSQILLQVQNIHYYMTFEVFRYHQGRLFLAPQIYICEYQMTNLIILIFHSLLTQLSLP